MYILNSVISLNNMIVEHRDTFFFPIAQVSLELAM
jgi:hypothetical protein